MVPALFATHTPDRVTNRTHYGTAATAVEFHGWEGNMVRFEGKQARSRFSTSDF